MNKYAENISDIITLDATEEIVDIFLQPLEKTDKTTGIVANKELIEYAMGEALTQDWINVRRVDIELEDLEYMLSVDDDGDLVVQPVIEYADKYFSSMETVYISMDGDVSQDVIDNCIDRDVNVILFGYEDEPNEECDCKECTCKNNNELSTMGSYFVNGVPVDKKAFDEYDKVFKARVKEFEDEMDACRRMLFRW